MLLAKIQAVMEKAIVISDEAVAEDVRMISEALALPSALSW
jgi:hypothetical protein